MFNAGKVFVGKLIVLDIAKRCQLKYLARNVFVDVTWRDPKQLEINLKKTAKNVV